MPEITTLPARSHAIRRGVGRALSCFAALALLATPAPAQPPANAGPARTDPPLLLTGVHSFSGPEETRVVLEFSRPTAYVAPDSGASRTLTLSIPATAVGRASGVEPMLRIRDGVVDSVASDTQVDGARFQLWFKDSARFHVLALPAQDGQPFRLVVDVERSGAASAVARRLERIAQGKDRDRVRVVAVDAGHGGEDAGAQGPRNVGVLEKTVTLAVARALVAELNRIPGVRGELIRDGDYFIPLRERYLLAERMKADLFVSIHANSSRKRGAGKGTEVYFLSLRGASDQADADLADLENAADRVGGVPPQTDNDLVNILYDVKRASVLEQSQLLAETLLDHVATDRRLESRGIKQAGFVVLKSVEFPSVLVETAFINNPVEARLLKSVDFQKRIAAQLAAGVRNYFQRTGVVLTDSQIGGSARR